MKIARPIGEHCYSGPRKIDAARLPVYAIKSKDSRAPAFIRLDIGR
jgi:hypothetical protein